MSKKRPYQEIDQEFSDLPLPDGEVAWQKMKQLLDDDDDDIVPPPVFFRSCLGWGLLFLGLIGAWLMIRPEKWWSEAPNGERPPRNQPHNQKSSETPAPFEQNPGQSIQTQKQEQRNIKAVPKTSETYAVTKLLSKKKQELSIPSKAAGKKDTSDPETKKSGMQEESLYQQPANKTSTLTANEDHMDWERDTSVTKDEKQAQKEDTNTKQPEIKRMDSSVQRKNIQPKKKMIVAAGIGEQQQIPIAGQTAVPYSHYGRKGSLADYIPSVYIKFENQNKWFVQAEFRYGGAQSVKEFSFARKTKFDTSALNITTTTQRLKKTYYHQFPVSFNYYIHPNLSVGVGGMYSRFYRAVIENETKISNVQTGAQTVSKQIMPMKGFTDSFLYKTQAHILLQADYQWKKFVFGLRYSRDVQPYIRYTRPDGTVDEEKNQSLQFTIRYQLWRSRRW